MPEDVDTDCASALVAAPSAASARIAADAGPID
jgi:hypothetical protein